MFNPGLLLDSLPDIWKTYFKDVDLLKAMYGYIGTELSHTLEQVISPTASNSITYTPLTREALWGIVQVNREDYIEILNPNDNSAVVCMYGLVVPEGFVEDCYRLYTSPRLEAKYLEKQAGFEIFRSSAPEVQSILARSGRPEQDYGYTHYLVTKQQDIFSNPDWDTVDNIGFTDTPNLITIDTQLISTADKDILESSAVINLSSGTSSYRSSILYTDLEGTLLNIYLIPQALLTNRPASLRFTIDDISSNIEVKLENYPVDVKLVNLWGLNCKIDDYELYNKFGFLLDLDGAVIRSTERYRNILEVLRTIRLKGLSVQSLRLLGNVFFNSSVLRFSYEEDPIIELNLLTELLRTNTQFYTINAKTQFNLSVINSTPRFIGSFGSKLASDCGLLYCKEYYTLLARYLIDNKTIEVKTTQDVLVGTLILLVDNYSFVFIKATTALDSNNPVRLYLTTTNYITASTADYSVTSLQAQAYSGDTYINSFFTVEDINTDPTWWYTNGVLIPKNIWNTDSGRRRTVDLTTWARVVGGMTQHRVGDYDLKLPTTEEISSPPNVEETGYKLFRDFLQNKTCLISYNYTNDLRGQETLTQVKDLCKNLINADKNIFTNNLFEVADFIGDVSEDIQVNVAPNPAVFDEQMQAVGNEGIGRADILLYLELSNNAHGIALNDIITISGNSMTVVGVYQQFILLSSASNLAVVGTYTQAPSTITFNSTAYTVNYGYYTNIIVDSNTPATYSLTVGNSYPDYTPIYNHPSNSVGQALEIRITP